MILKGLDVSNHLCTNILERGKEMEHLGIVPTLGIVRVGEKEEDIAYERNIIKRFENLRMNVKVVSLPSDAPDDEVVDVIRNMNTDSRIHGILLFRPLFAHLDENRIRNSICEEKDVDCASDAALASIFLNKSKRLPCTPRAVMEMLSYYDIPLAGKNVVVIGRSMVVGKPLANRLLQENATVTIAHSQTADLASICKRADIIVVATGHVHTLSKEMVHENVIIIDVGINFVDGKIVGDVDFADICDTVKAISPVPGGVGSITTGVLAMQIMENADTVSTH